MNINYFTYIFFFFSHIDSFFSNIKYILYCIIYYFNYNIFIITSKDNKNLVFKQITDMPYFCTKYDENNLPIGLIVHKSLIPKFILFQRSNNTINSQYETTKLICKKDFYNNILNKILKKDEIVLDKNYIPNKSKTSTVNNNFINYITKTGEYGYFQYGSRNVNLEELSLHKELIFYEKQLLLFKDIMNFYKKNSFCKVFLSGEPGIGKTYFAYLMSQKLNCYLCDIYNPYEPSSNFNEIYSMSKVNSGKPIIVILDEIDILIEKINNKTINEHKKFSKEIYNKTSWNKFMDRIEYGMFPYVIFIMTSNKKKKYIDIFDKCYLREGRANIICEW